MSAILLTIQNDFVSRLLGAAEFVDVAIFAQRKALTEAEVANVLKTVKGRSGKIGTCVMVQMPVLDVVNPNLPGPAIQVSQSLLVLEHPTLNSGSQGTGKSGEQLAVDALRLFHHFVPAGVTQCFTGDRNAIVPDDSLDGLVAYLVTVSAPLQLTIPAKVIRPKITTDNGEESPCTVTLACATAGAAIRYTTDGSYPSASNPAAHLYSAPFTQATAATIRTAASKAEMQESDIGQSVIS